MWSSGFWLMLGDRGLREFYIPRLYVLTFWRVISPTKDILFLFGAIFLFGVVLIFGVVFVFGVILWVAFIFRVVFVFGVVFIFWVVLVLYVWVWHSLPLFVLFSCSSKYVGFVKLIYIKDHIDDETIQGDKTDRYSEILTYWPDVVSLQHW